MVPVHELSAEQTVAILELAQRATEHDGVAPLSEQTLLAVRRGGSGRHHLSHDGDVLVGYAYVEGDSGELVIDPAYRGRGHGKALLEELGPVHIWAHGDLPAAAALGRAVGYDRVRTLLQLRRSLADELPVMRIHAGYSLRTFEPEDVQPWLRLNARAFADHPEQGAWTLADLQNRMQEPWFDPTGFFIAVKGDQLVGFHWTKIHPDGLGEVYVVGVDPSAQGVGLGRTLTLAGLHHLKAKGIPTVLLYVDEENTSAVRLYESLGFTRYHVDVQYAAPTGV